MNTIITGIIGIIASIATGVSSYLFTKKKYNSEVDATIIENLTKSLEFYKKICDDNTTRLEQLLKLNQELEQKIVTLNKEVADLRNQLTKKNNK